MSLQLEERRGDPHYPVEPELINAGLKKQKNEHNSNYTERDNHYTE
jgi:hypothetical protein